MAMCAGIEFAALAIQAGHAPASLARAADALLDDFAATVHGDARRVMR
jgi:hypothetical protein